MAEQPKKLVSKEKIGVVTILVLVTAAIFLAIGYWAGTKDSENATVATPPVPPTPTATTSASATATDETASWKTYTNDTYGFSFKYPGTWTIEEGASSTYPSRVVSVKSSEPNKNKIWPGSDNTYYYDQMIVSKETESSIADWIKTRLAAGSSDNSKIVTINGAEYTEIVPGSDPEYLAELRVDNGQLFSVIFDWASSRSDITSTQEKILSTLQFTK